MTHGRGAPSDFRRLDLWRPAIGKGGVLLFERGWDRAPQAHASEDCKDIRVTIPQE